FGMPAVSDYWKRDGIHPQHPINESMGQTRFEQIQRYFHISGPQLETDKENNDEWSYKIRPLADHIRQVSQTTYQVGSNCSIDEAMVRFTGRSKHTYKMPNKPISEGYKIWVLANGGYIWDFRFHSRTANNHIKRIPGLSDTSSIVYDLAKSLPYKRMAF